MISEGQRGKGMARTFIKKEKRGKSQQGDGTFWTKEHRRHVWCRIKKTYMATEKVGEESSHK